MLRKQNKLNHTTVTSYCIISLLNYLGKIFKKVVAHMLSEGSQVNHVLHESPIGSSKQRSTIDEVTQVVGKLQEALAEGNLAGMLLMDVKGAFDHVSESGLLGTMEAMGTEGDLIKSTESFVSNRRVRLIIDLHQCEERVVDTGVPQGSPVSLIPFAIYLSGVF